MAAIISEFVLDEFQAGNPLEILDLGNGLNVALVASEEDRARMLKVIPWTLYGPGSYFARPTRDVDQLQPPGKVGVAVLSTDHGVFHIERDWYNESTTPLLTANDGRAYEPEYLRELLEGVTPKTFREVFTFELARMARMVRHETYGLDRLPKLTDYLRSKSPQLTPSANANPQLNLRGFQTRLDELKQLVAYGAAGNEETTSVGEQQDKLRRELGKLDSEIADARGKLKQLHAEMDETQYAMASNRMQMQLKDINSELVEIRGTKNAKTTVRVDADAAARLDDKIAAARRELADLKEEAGELRRQGRDLGNLSRMNQLMPQIEGLMLQEKSLLKEDAAIDQLEMQIRDLESRIESERLQATVRPTEFAPPTNSIQETHAQARVDALTQRMQDAERDLQLIEERLVRAETSSSLAREQMARASALAAHPEEAVAIHEAEQRVVQLRDLLGLDDQLQRMLSEQDDLSHQVQRLYSRQLMPFRVVMALGIPFLIGVAMIIYGLIMYNGDPNWKLILLGFATTIGTSLFKISFDQQTTGRLHSSRRQLTRLNQRIDEISSAREESAVSGISLTRQLEDAERELDLLQTRFASRETQVSPFGGDTTRSAGNAETARMQLAEGQRRVQELNHAWRELMIELNLSPNLGPEHAREALATRSFQSPTSPVASGPSVAEQLTLQLQQLRQDLERRRDWLSVIGGQARQLVSEIGTTYGGANIVEQLQILRQAFDEHREHMQTRRTLLRGLKRLKQKAERVRETGRRFASQRRKLDDEVRWKNQQVKQRTKLQGEKVRQLEKQRDAIQSELTEIRDRFGLDSDSELTKLTDAELESRMDSLNGKLSRIQDRLVKQSEQRGRCRALLNLSSNDDDESAPFAWQDILAKTQEISNACEQLARETAIRPSRTERFQYLDEASSYLKELTYGQYVEIDTPEEGQITLIDRDGLAVDFRSVRREHYANIYFSLWLARISAYANRGLRLPIVMEDPLEATPMERKVEVARMLRDFAARSQHQVILVTSDPHNADVFAQLDVPIADLWSEPPVVAEETFTPPKEFELVESVATVPAASPEPRPVAARQSHGEPLFPPIS